MNNLKSKIKYKGIDSAFDILVNILLFAALLIVLYPLYLVVIASFSDPDALINGEVRFWPVEITLLGYQKIFRDAKIWIGYKNTVIYTVLGTAINVVITLMAAYPLSRKSFRYRSHFMVFFMITMYFGGGLIPTYLVSLKLGLVDNWLVMVVSGAVTVWNLIVTRTYYQTTIPEELFEAASIDGSSHLYFFTRVVIPLSSAIIAVNTLYYGVGHWNEFFTALIYLRRKELFPLQLVLREILIQNRIEADAMEGLFHTEDFQKTVELMKYSTIIVSSLPVMILYPFLQKYFVRGVVVGALKG